MPLVSLDRVVAAVDTTARLASSERQVVYRKEALTLSQRISDAVPRLHVYVASKVLLSDAAHLLAALLILAENINDLLRQVSAEGFASRVSHRSADCALFAAYNVLLESIVADMTPSAEAEDKTAETRLLAQDALDARDREDDLRVRAELAGEASAEEWLQRERGLLARVPGFVEERRREGARRRRMLRAAPAVALLCVDASDVLWRYPLGAIGADGSFGRVYKGDCGGAAAAIKVLRLAGDAEDVSELRREALLLQSIEHSCVARFLGARQDASALWIVTELAACSLSDLLHSHASSLSSMHVRPPKTYLLAGESERFAWSLPLRLALLCDVCSAMVCLHSLDVLHRDLTSANVLIDQHYRAKVTDFGLASIKQRALTTANSSATMLAKSCYQAPEVITERRHSKQSDVYSLGTLMNEALTGLRPFPGMSAPLLVVSGVRPSTIPCEADMDGVLGEARRCILACWAAEAESRPCVVFADAAVACCLMAAGGDPREGDYAAGATVPVAAALTSLPVDAPTLGSWLVAAGMSSARAKRYSLVLDKDGVTSLEQLQTRVGANPKYLDTVLSEADVAPLMRALALDYTTGMTTLIERAPSPAPAEPSKCPAIPAPSAPLDMGRWRNVQSLRGHNSDVLCLCVLSSGFLASGSADKSIRVWHPSNFDFVCTLAGHTGEVRCMALLPSGLMASGSADRTIRIWDTNKFSCVRTLTGHGSDVYCLLVLGGNRLVSGSTDRTIKLWDLSKFDVVRSLSGHTNDVRCLSSLPNGLLVSGSKDRSVRVWDLVKYQCVSTLVGHINDVYCLCGLQGGFIASGSADQSIRIWDPVSYECVHILSGHTDFVVSLCVLPTGYLASGSRDQSIRVWDPSATESFRILSGHTKTVTCMALHPSGLLISGSTDKSVRVWGE